MTLKELLFGRQYPFLYFGLIIFIVLPLLFIYQLKSGRKAKSYTLKSRFSLLMPGEEVKKTYLVTHVNKKNEFDLPLLAGEGDGEMITFYITTKNRLLLAPKQKEHSVLEIQPQEVKQIQFKPFSEVESKGKISLMNKRILEFTILTSSEKEFYGWLKKVSGFKDKISVEH